MIKIFLKVITFILISLLIFLFYFVYFGFSTSKFNTLIKDKIKSQNSNLDIELKQVKLHLDLKNISIKIKTKNPKIIINNSNNIELREITSNISIFSYFQNKYAIKNVSIKSKNNEISSYINFYRINNNSLQLIFLNKIIKNGKAKINVDLFFDDYGKIKNNYNLTGKISNVELQVDKNTKIKELNFKFAVKDKNYKFEQILFEFEEIKLNSDLLNIQKKDNKFYVNGKIKSKKNKLYEDIVLLIFKNNLDNFDYSRSKFESISEFSFNLSKKFKIKDLKINSKINVDELILKYDLYKIKNYI